MKANMDIRTELTKYEISYSDLAEFIEDKKYSSRIAVELRDELDEKRKAVYFKAIQDVKDKKIKDLMS